MPPCRRTSAARCARPSSPSPSRLAAVGTFALVLVLGGVVLAVRLVRNGGKAPEAAAANPPTVPTYPARLPGPEHPAPGPAPSAPGGVPRPAGTTPAPGNALRSAPAVAQ